MAEEKKRKFEERKEKKEKRKGSKSRNSCQKKEKKVKKKVNQKNPRLQQTVTWRSYLSIHAPVVVYATILTLTTHGWSVTIVKTGITSDVPVCLFWTTWATTWTSLVKCVLKKDFLHTNTPELALVTV